MNYLYYVSVGGVTLKRVIQAANEAVPEKYDEFLRWALEDDVYLADYEISSIKEDGKDYLIEFKYVGNNDKDMMPTVHLRAINTKDDEFEFEGKFEYPDIVISDSSYYDDVEAFTHYWNDNAKYWSKIFKYTLKRSDYIDE